MCKCALAALSAIGATGVMARAQPSAALDARRSLASCVPPRAGFFLQISDLEKFASVVRVTPAAQLLQSVNDQRGDDHGAGAMAAWLSAALGLPRSTPLVSAIRGEVAVAALSWRRLPEGILILRPLRRDVLLAWVSPDRVARTTMHGRAKAYLLRNGLWLATDGYRAVLSARAGRGTLFDEVADLIGGRTQRSLLRHPSFVQLARRLPRARLSAFAYFDRGGVSRTRPAASSFGRWWPAMRRGMVALQFNGDQVRMVLRGATDRGNERLAGFDRGVPIKVLRRLPQTTLLVMAGSVDVDRWLRTTVSDSADGAWSALASWFRAADGAAARRALANRLGPRSIALWGQDLREDRNVPQVALMIESDDAAAAAAEIEAFIRRLVQTTPASEQQGPPGGLPLTSEHLGVAMVQLPLTELSLDPRPSPMLSQLTPTVATLGEWLVVATSPEMVRELIDARAGLIPTWGTLNLVDTALAKSSRSVAIIQAQPALIASVLDGWLSGDATERWWEPEVRSRSADESAVDDPGRSLGIAFQIDHQPGTMVIARVDARRSVSGDLLVGDRVVGVEGRWFSLDDPAGDLRRVLRDLPDAAHVVLRVERSGRLFNVVMSPRDRRVNEAALHPEAREALRHLRTAAATLSFVNLDVRPTPPEWYDLDVYLRLEATAAPLAAARTPP